MPTQRLFVIHVIDRPARPVRYDPQIPRAAYDLARRYEWLLAPPSQEALRWGARS